VFVRADRAGATVKPSERFRARGSRFLRGDEENAGRDYPSEEDKSEPFECERCGPGRACGSESTPMTKISDARLGADALVHLEPVKPGRPAGVERGVERAGGEQDAGSNQGRPMRRGRVVSATPTTLIGVVTDAPVLTSSRSCFVASRFCRRLRIPVPLGNSRGPMRAERATRILVEVAPAT